MNLLEYFAYLEEEVVAQKQNAAGFIKKTYKHKWQGLPGFDNIDEFIEKLADIDPSKNGGYMRWMAKCLINNPDVNKTEDLKRFKKDLEAFEDNKSKLKIKDINAYKDFHELYAAIEPFVVKRPKTEDEKKREKKEARLAKTREGITTLYDGPEGWVKIPMNKAASQFIGQGTRWCTSARNDNRFKYYDDQDRLIVIYDKKSGARTQLHIATGSYNDVKDKPVSIDTVPEWARKPIAHWYKENSSKLGIKHVMTLASFGSEDIHKGTDHEDAVNLMKQYGVI